jgi:hypothetical protein
MPPAAKHHGAPKPQALGTRVGKFLNKAAKLKQQRDERLANAPKEIEAWYKERHAKLIAETDDEVLKNQGLGRE